MYAVIKTGGKQYRVAKNDVIVVEKLAADPGQTVEFDEVLMMDGGDGLSVGAPLVDGARVAATVLDQTRGEKIIVFKKKRRKNFRRTRGHRQDLTVLRVTDILAKGVKASAAAAPAPQPEPAPEPKEEPPQAEPAEAAPAEAPVEAPAQPEPVEAAPVEEAPVAAEPAEAAAKKPAKKPAAKKKAAGKKPAKKAAAKKPAKKAAKKAPAKKKPAKKKPS